MKRHYVAVIEAAEGGFGLYFPDLPGCITGADTLTELLANAHEALQMHVDSMVEDGETIPAPTEPDLDIERAAVPEADLRMLAAIEVIVPAYPNTVSVALRTDLVREISELVAKNLAGVTSRQFVENAARHELDRLKKSA